MMREITFGWAADTLMELFILIRVVIIIWEGAPQYLTSLGVRNAKNSIPGR